jgi:hypothetical protein
LFTNALTMNSVICRWRTRAGLLQLAAYILNFTEGHRQVKPRSLNATTQKLQGRPMTFARYMAGLAST